MLGRLHAHPSGRTEPGAPTLVLLHGITNSGAVWVDAVRRWSATYRIVALDALGHGESQRFTDAELAGSGDEAGAGATEALVTTTIDALEQITADAPPVVLYGHSMGGAMATTIAVRRPELLRGLLLEDPAWIPQTLAIQASRGAEWMATSHRFRADPQAAIAEALADPDSTWPPDEIAPWVLARTQLDDRFIAIGRPEMRERWQQSVAALSVPTLLLTGTDQVIIDSNVQAELATIGNPQLRVAVIEGAGHSVRRDRSDAFHAVADPWIADRFRS